MARRGGDSHKVKRRDYDDSAWAKFVAAGAVKGKETARSMEGNTIKRRGEESPG